MSLNRMLEQTLRAHRRVAAFAVLAVLLSLVAAPAFGAPVATSPTPLPRIAAPASADGPLVQALSAQSIGQFVGVGPDGVAPAAVTASDVALPFDGGYYWSGTYLNIDGWVTNDTSADAGPVLVHFVVQTTGGATLKDEIGVAAVYNLKPGESATFKMMYELPSYEGQDMNVLVETLAGQPALFPEAMELAFVDKSSVTDAEGVRQYTFTFKNDTASAVENPLFGGWEFDADGAVFSTLVGASQTRVEPGATVTIVTYGISTASTVTDVQFYCQAVPAPVQKLDPVFRFYNPSKGTHFYTVSPEERDLVMARWPQVFSYEGIAYYTNAATNAQPLYRFYYNRGGTHFYTASVEEATLILTKWPNIFTYEGPTYRVSATQKPGSQTVYRFINRKNSSHFFTASAEEADYVKSRWSSTYIYEGPAFWIAP